MNSFQAEWLLHFLIIVGNYAVHIFGSITITTARQIEMSYVFDKRLLNGMSLKFT